MEKKSAEELEGQLQEYLGKEVLPCEDLVKFVTELSSGSGKAKAWILQILKAYESRNDFNGSFAFVEGAQSNIAQVLDTAAGETLYNHFRKLTKDNRLLLSFVEGVGFGTRTLKESVGRLGRLLSYTKGALVLSKAWGLGEVRDIDPFYRRVMVDFRTRRGHQFNYDAACETLVPAPEKHILVTQRADPPRIEKMLKDEPGEFVMEMLRSFGDMPITRLEELSAQYGFVKSVNWKPFWERARGELRRNKLVDIPTRRADSLHLKEAVEDYGDGWFTALSRTRDAKAILALVRELQAQKRMPSAEDEKQRDRLNLIAERLAFALKAARGVDDSLFAQVAFCIADLKLDAQLAADSNLEFAVSEKSREYLWSPLLSGETRYLAAARELPARDMEALVAFMTGSENEESRNAAKATLLADLPKMCFPLLTVVVMKYKEDEACADVVDKLLRDPNAPATLVTLLLGRYKSFEKWHEKLPPLVLILMHAIVLGEGKQGGEILRMQNMVRRLFADQTWLEKTLDLLNPSDKALFFERFQASIAWDPSTHHLIVMRMVRHAPELSDRLVKKVDGRKVERVTSLRSYAELQLAYEKLTKERIPENTRRIEFAKSYGDLSENAEYQYAKDEQRQLMQEESRMQKDLNEIKSVDFSDVRQPTVVVAGSIVVIVAANGEEKTYAVLGELDNAPERGIISNKSPLGMKLVGKKAGEEFELSDAEGNVSNATIKSVGELTDDIRAWIATTPNVA